MHRRLIWQSNPSYFGDSSGLYITCFHCSTLRTYSYANYIMESTSTVSEA